MSHANLLDAMVAHMRADAALVAAFGDDVSALATDKFWPTPVRSGVELPWAVYEDGGGNTQYTTGPASVEDSAIRFVVVGDGRDTSLALARLLIATLNDAPLEFDDGLLMYFRCTGAPSVVPITAITGDYPNAYAYALTFSTMVQRTA